MTKVHTDNHRQAVLVQDFLVKDELQPVSTVKAVLPKEDKDSYPTYPTKGLILQNTSSKNQYVHNDDGHSDNHSHHDDQSDGIFIYFGGFVYVLLCP